ncbi:MAG: glycosyltransferase [Candidatus Shapirobacteria bacterium]|nr:glycosyltransferase [Candidatus Shapirobacteria bacterium]
MSIEKTNNDLMVTIRCLAYNHEPYIRQCLEGFVMQKTNFKFEAIVHDDASTDGTAIIIREYAEKYPAIIKPIYETENQYSKHDGSLQKIMNAHTHGKYVAICEGDDYWIDPLKLQKQVDFLEANPEYGLVRTDICVFYQKRNKFKKNRMKEIPIKDTFDDYLVNAWFAGTCTWLFRSFFNEKKSNFPNYVVGDLPLLLEISSNSKIKFLEDCTAVYRVLPQSASHMNDCDKQLVYLKGIYIIQKDFAENNNKQELIPQIEWIYLYKRMKVLIEFNEFNELKVVIDQLLQLKKLYRLNLLKLFISNRILYFLFCKIVCLYIHMKRNLF